MSHEISKDRHLFEICAPSNNRIFEHKEVEDLKCSKCYGTGTQKHLTTHNHSEVKVCSYCKGTGKIKAIITIQYLPDDGKR